MTPIELYHLVKPDLPLLSFDRTDTMCSSELYHKYNSCSKCPYYSSRKMGGCGLWLSNQLAKSTKNIIYHKHPEYFI